MASCRQNVIHLQVTFSQKATNITPQTHIQKFEILHLSDNISTGNFFEEWNKITPQIHIGKFEELKA